MGTQVHSDPSYSTFQAVYTAAPGLENIQEGASLCVRAGEGCGRANAAVPEFAGGSRSPDGSSSLLQWRSVNWAFRASEEPDPGDTAEQAMRSSPCFMGRTV